MKFQIPVFFSIAINFNASLDFINHHYNVKILLLFQIKKKIKSPWWKRTHYIIKQTVKLSKEYFYDYN